MNLPSPQPEPSNASDGTYSGPPIQVNTQNNHLHIGQIDLPDPARFNAFPPEAQKTLLSMTQKEQNAQISSLVLAVLVFYKALEFVKAGMTAQGFTVMLGAMTAFVIAVITGRISRGKSDVPPSDKL